MTKAKLARYAKVASHKLSKVVPNVLAYLGAAGVVGTAVVTAKETPKAIETYNSLHADDPEGKISLYTITETAKCYIPAAAVGGASIGCILGGNHLHNRRYSYLFNRYTDLAVKHREFKRETSKVLGEAGTAAIAGAAATNLHPEQNNLSNGDLPEGKEWFYLDYYGLWFVSDWETVMMADCTIQKEYGAFGYATLENYCEYLGIDDGDLPPLKEEHYWSDYWIGDCCWIHDKGIPIEYDHGFRCGDRVGTCIGFVVDPEIVEMAFPDGINSLMY